MIVSLTSRRNYADEELPLAPDALVALKCLASS